MDIFYLILESFFLKGGYDLQKVVRYGTTLKNLFCVFEDDLKNKIQDLRRNKKFVK